MHKNSEVTLLQLNKSIEAVKLVQKLLIYAGVFISLFSFVVVVQVMPDAVQYSAQEYMQVFGNNFAVAILKSIKNSFGDCPVYFLNSLLRWYLDIPANEESESKVKGLA